MAVCTMGSHNTAKLAAAAQWLRWIGLDGDQLSGPDRIQWHKALSKYQFGQLVPDGARRRFLSELVPFELNLEAFQTDIGRVDAPKYHYKLTLRNEAPIRFKPI
jgi:hypothetical protein